MSDETVQVPKSEIEALIASNKALAERISALENETPPVKKRGSPTEPTVHVRFINGKAVVGYANRGTATRPHYVYDRPDALDPKKIVQYVDVQLDGEEKPIALKYVEFLRESERVSCRVLRREEHPWHVDHGMTTRKVVPESEYRTEDTGIEVPLHVDGVSYRYVVALPDGSELTLDEAHVNI